MLPAYPQMHMYCATEFIVDKKEIGTEAFGPPLGNVDGQ